MAEIDVAEVCIRIQSKKFQGKILDVVVISKDGKEVSVPYRIESWTDLLLW